jgi:hypothetical protein
MIPKSNLLGTTALVLVLTTGCNRPAATPSSAAKTQADPAEALTDTVAQSFRKSGDAKAFRQLVDSLNSALSGGNIERKPQPLSPEQRAALKTEYGLTEPEIAEVARPEFTPLDAYYLDETVLYRDITRALDVTGLKPLEKARAALNWIVVNLRPLDLPGSAIPPWYVALRGVGTNLERSYCLLRLLHQLDLDACLVGDESAAGSADGLWAVGVLADGQIHLLDVRLGLPLPGANRGVLTLEQARKDANAFQPLAIDEKLRYDVTPERAKAAQVFLTAPLSALSPRMRFLQSLLPANAGRLDYDPRAARERFEKVVQGPAYEGCRVRFWDPPLPDAMPRVLMSFLPAGEGGSDREPHGRRRLDRFYSEPIPWQALPPILREGSLPGEPGQRVRTLFADRMTFLSQPGQARELILRGLFDEATTRLIELQGRMDAKPASQADVEKGVVTWVNAARDVYGRLARAEREMERNPAAIADRDKAREEIGNLWRNANIVNVYMNYVVSEPLQAEITYLLAICKHEEALRRAYRGEDDKASWKTTERWWEKFIHTYNTSHAIATAKRNYARTLEGAGRPAEAKAVYQALTTSDLPELQRLACAYLANQIK